MGGGCGKVDKIVANIPDSPGSIQVIGKLNLTFVTLNDMKKRSI